MGDAGHDGPPGLGRRDVRGRQASGRPPPGPDREVTELAR